nr:RDD family protein [Rhodanobacter sp. MP7CTX1]
MRMMLAIARALRKRLSTMPENPSATAPPCPLWRRLLALVYDLLIVVAIMMVAVMIGLLLTHGQLVDAQGRMQALWFPPFEGALVAAYFMTSWLRGGQTIGMRPWHIRVTRADGGTPSLQQVVIRVLVASAPLLLLMLEPRIGLHATLWALLLVWAGWFAVALFDPRKRALHDLAANTEIRLLV